MSSFFTRVMEFYRSCSVSCMNARLESISSLARKRVHISFFMPSPALLSNSMRIAKRIARSGVCSRREAEELIKTGRVSLNGVLVTSPALNVTPKDSVCVDNVPLHPIQRTRVIVANKLSGELITKKDERGNPCDVPLVERRITVL